jgi:hypothetical protein
VIGYGHCILAEGLGGFYEVIDPDGPVQEAVLGMAVEMDKPHLSP